MLVKINKSSPTVSFCFAKYEHGMFSHQTVVRADHGLNAGTSLTTFVATAWLLGNWSLINSYCAQVPMKQKENPCSYISICIRNKHMIIRDLQTSQRADY